MIHGIDEKHPLKKTLKRIGKIIAKIIMLVASLLMVFFGVSNLYRMHVGEEEYQNKVATWNKEVATITDVKKTIKSNVNSSQKITSFTTYEQKTYVYNVNGVEHKLEIKEHLKGTLAKKGDTANIFYDKEDPSQAILETNEKNTLGKGLLYFFTGIGLILSISIIRHIRED